LIKDSIMEVKNLNLWYGKNQALIGINMEIHRNKVTALIGPSGCGKSTLIRCFNRMNDVIDGVKIEGGIIYGGTNIYDRSVDVMKIRTNVGMIFQKPNPFPKSIFDNVSYGPRIHGTKKKKKLKRIVENSLKQAALWDEVRDRLDESAMGLSGGQQQRLCIARALAIEPDVVLMDEPTSALDPLATSRIEDLIFDLKKKYTVVIVTHNMQQAARVSEYTGFMYLGKLIEYGPTKQIFQKPREELTERYITGRFG
jgi:phosphate transport system ATP-binding protein